MRKVRPRGVKKLAQGGSWYWQSQDLNLGILGLESMLLQYTVLYSAQSRVSELAGTFTWSESCPLIFTL